MVELFYKGGFVRLFIKGFLSFIVLFILSTKAVAASVDGFKTLKDGRKIYVNYELPKNNLPTVVLINGLTYSTDDWALITYYLTKMGYGVFRYDAWGMGQTLLENEMPTKAINYKTQVSDLMELLKLTGVKGPYNLAGLSYGGGIAAAFAEAYPRDIKNLILMAPYTEFLKAQKEWITKQIELTRKMFPWNKATDEELVDFFVRQLAYSTYPFYEPSALENPFKMEGIVCMVQGIRMYQPIEQAHTMPARSVHLMVAGMDQYVERDVLDRYWSAVGKGSGRASYMLMLSTEHKMAEKEPKFSAEWISLILKGTPELFKGNKFEGYPMFSIIKDENGNVIPVTEKK
jgi:pimeloyl-ACP methyl ester carboxylesterase